MHVDHFEDQFSRMSIAPVCFAGRYPADVLLRGHVLQHGRVQGGVERLLVRLQHDLVCGTEM